MKHKRVSMHFRETSAGSSELKQNPNKGLAAAVFGKNKRYLLVGAGTVLDLAGSGLKTPVLQSVRDDASRVSRDFWSIGDDARTVLTKHSFASFKR